MESTTLYEKILFENLEKNFEYRLTISEFRGEQYLNIRKYFQTFEGDFVPSKEGATFPATLQTIFSLLDGLIELCSKEESIDSITKHFETRISDLKSKNK